VVTVGCFSGGIIPSFGPKQNTELSAALFPLLGDVLRQIRLRPHFLVNQLVFPSFIHQEQLVALPGKVSSHSFIILPVSTLSTLVR
jgi:hypothetical protein